MPYCSHCDAITDHLTVKCPTPDFSNSKNIMHAPVGDRPYLQESPLFRKLQVELAEAKRDNQDLAAELAEMTEENRVLKAAVIKRRVAERDKKRRQRAG